MFEPFDILNRPGHYIGVYAKGVGRTKRLYTAPPMSLDDVRRQLVNALQELANPYAGGGNDYIENDLTFEALMPIYVEDALRSKDTTFALRAIEEFASICFALLHREEISAGPTFDPRLTCSHCRKRPADTIEKPEEGAGVVNSWCLDCWSTDMYAEEADVDPE